MYLVELQQLIDWLSTFNYLLVLADSPRSQVKILLFQFLKCEYFLLFLLFCDSKLIIFRLDVILGFRIH